jgi:flagellar basal-body rod protein FlgG
MNLTRRKLLVVLMFVAGLGLATWRWRESLPAVSATATPPTNLPAEVESDGLRLGRESHPPPLLSAEWPRTAPAYFDPDLIDPEIYGGAVHADGLIITRPRDPAIPGSAERTPPAPLVGSDDALPIDERTAQAARELEDLVQRELADLPDEQRRVWLGVLQGMPVEEAEEILHIWKLTSGGGQQSQGAPQAEEPPLPPAIDVAAPHWRELRTWQAEQSRLLLTNLRHVETPGYRRRELALAGGTLLDLTPGPVHQSGNPFHLAIDGEGFFVLKQGERTALTRCGRFDLSPQGELIQLRAEGVWRLDPSLRIPPESIRFVVDGRGRATVIGADEQLVAAGELKLATVLNPQHLETLAGDLLAPTTASGPLYLGTPGSSGVGTLRQGVWEGSNATLAGEAAALERLERQAELFRRAERLSRQATDAASR